MESGGNPRSWGKNRGKAKGRGKVPGFIPFGKKREKHGREA